VRQFPNSSFKDVVRPNVDTLYTTGFIDMAKGPWVFEMAANAQRYEVMPFMDGWTNVFATPGTRTTGTAGGRFLLAGPDWQGPVPEGMTLLRSPTRIVWLIGRTQTNGVADYPLVHRLHGLTLRSLAAWKEGRGATDEDTKAWQPAPVKPLPPIVQMQAMSAEAFFARLAMLMVANPPAAADAPMMVKLSRIGITPGQPPAWGLLDRWSVSLGRWIADWTVTKELKKPRDLVKGWSTPPAILGNYGTFYNTRGGGGHGRARGQSAVRRDLPEYPRRRQRRAAQREPPNFKSQIMIANPIQRSQPDRFRPVSCGWKPATSPCMSRLASTSTVRRQSAAGSRAPFRQQAAGRLGPASFSAAALQPAPGLAHGALVLGGRHGV
jgi:hypothetical protein